MPRPKRYEPYNPNKPHDRRATQFNKGVENHVAPEEVDDPYEPGATIIVMRQKRDDPLGSLKSCRSINSAQYEAGRAFQNDFETIERGAQAVDPSKPYVDCSRNPQPLSAAFSESLARLNKAERALGQDGSALTHDVLVSRKTYSQIATSRGLSGRRSEEYFGMRFRECLNCLAVVYGFAMEKR